MRIHTGVCYNTMMSFKKGDNAMIDIHCHILPSIDDGARSMEESVAMARMAVASGVTGIVTTPHFLGVPESLELMPELLAKLRKLHRACRAAGLELELYPGAEILCVDETVRLAEQGRLPTLSDGRYVLTEFRFDESWDFMDLTLDSIRRCGYAPVVAHPERYGAIQHDPRRIRRWFERGYVIQVNKGSVLRAFGTRVRDTAMAMLQDGTVHTIATDAHWSSRRTTDINAVTEWCEDHLGGSYTRILLEENPKRIVRGEEMAPIK